MLVVFTTMEASSEMKVFLRMPLSPTTWYNDGTLRVQGPSNMSNVLSSDIEQFPSGLILEPFHTFLPLRFEFPR